jgi:hypothetical protein
MTGPAAAPERVEERGLGARGLVLRAEDGPAEEASAPLGRADVDGRALRARNLQGAGQTRHRLPAGDAPRREHRPRDIRRGEEGRPLAGARAGLTADDRGRDLGRGVLRQRRPEALHVLLLERHGHHRRPRLREHRIDRIGGSGH